MSHPTAPTTPTRSAAGTQGNGLVAASPKPPCVRPHLGDLVLLVARAVVLLVVARAVAVAAEQAGAAGRGAAAPGLVRQAAAQQLVVEGCACGRACHVWVGQCSRGREAAGGEQGH